MDERWDPGEMGCGQLVFELSRRVKALPEGGQLEVTVRDLAAATDIPAWCRLTGHRLLSSEHPVYRIQRKPA